jgi:hypothetical protein
MVGQLSRLDVEVHRADGPPGRGGHHPWDAAVYQ